VGRHTPPVKPLDGTLARTTSTPLSARTLRAQGPPDAPRTDHLRSTADHSLDEIGVPRTPDRSHFNWIMIPDNTFPS
jgi:hypothetical protein